MDNKITELRGRNRLVEALLGEGIEVAIPMWDNKIDLVAYLPVGPPQDRFVAAPIQLKAASAERFVLNKK